MKKQAFYALLDKYLEGTANEEERSLLLQYYQSFQQSEEWNEAELGSSQKLELKILQQLHAKIKTQESLGIKRIYSSTRFRVAAAAVAIFIMGGILWWSVHYRTEQPVASLESTNPFPVKAKITSPTLTLADGRSIAFDNISNGLVAQQGHMDIKMLNGKLIYQPSQRPVAEKHLRQAYNIVSTPRGVQLEVEIPDGSKVWLNAASSIRFPAVFTGQERKVELTGEAYFEVVKDAAKPFRILTAPLISGSLKGAEVEVLGTHFNISAYDDDKEMTTTLLEGSVKVKPLNNPRQEQKKSVLRPGEQAQVMADSINQESILVTAADVEAVMAWRNHLFNFNKADIETIMRQIARWYDVEVVYEGQVPLRKFSGKISRNTDLANVLKILEQSNIQFRIQGKKIIVLS